MNIKQFDHIQDPIARAEALRAQAIVNTITDVIEGVRGLVQRIRVRAAANAEFRRTFEVLSAMTDRELDDIGICRGDIPAVARGIDPRPQAAEVYPVTAPARRPAQAEAEVAGLRANDNRPAVAA